MKNTCLILTVALILGGCVTIGTQPGATNSDSVTSSGIGAAIGCASGTVIAKLSGSSHNMLRACAAGAVVGGLIGYYDARQKEIAAAQAAAQQARATGVDATFKSESIPVTNQATGETKPVPQLTSMTYRIEPRHHSSDAELDAAITAGKLAAMIGGTVEVENGSPIVRNALQAGIDSVSPSTQPVRVSQKTEKFNSKAPTIITVTRTVGYSI